MSQSARGGPDRPRMLLIVRRFHRSCSIGTVLYIPPTLGSILTRAVFKFVFLVFSRNFIISRYRKTEISGKYWEKLKTTPREDRSLVSDSTGVKLSYLPLFHQ